MIHSEVIATRKRWKLEMSAKLALMKFLKETNSPQPADFVIVLENSTIKNAEKFVHRMRVELSRMRDMVRENGMIPRPFKMICVSIKEVDSRITITLRKQLSKTMKISEDVEEVFDVLVKSEQKR